jgi:hypothetical protein
VGRAEDDTTVEDEAGTANVEVCELDVVGFALDEAGTTLETLVLVTGVGARTNDVVACELELVRLVQNDALVTLELLDGGVALIGRLVDTVTEVSEVEVPTGARTWVLDAG